MQVVSRQYSIYRGEIHDQSEAIGFQTDSDMEREFINWIPKACRRFPGTSMLHHLRLFIRATQSSKAEAATTNYEINGYSMPVYYEHSSALCIYFGANRCSEAN